MWAGQAKTVVVRIVLSRCRGGSSLPLRRPMEVCWRRMSTTSSGGHHGDATGEVVLAEPDPEVLEILVCPFTKEPLTYDREARKLLSPAGVAFPITKNGIPNMIPASARIVSQD